MTKKKLKTVVLNIGGKQKKFRVSEAVFNVYVGLLTQNYLS